MPSATPSPRVVASTGLQQPFRTGTAAFSAARCFPYSSTCGSVSSLVTVGQTKMLDPEHPGGLPHKAATKGLAKSYQGQGAWGRQPSPGELMGHCMEHGPKSIFACTWKQRFHAITYSKALQPGLKKMLRFEKRHGAGSWPAALKAMQGRPGSRWKHDLAPRCVELSRRQDADLQKQSKRRNGMRSIGIDLCEVMDDGGRAWPGSKCPPPLLHRRQGRR